MTLLYFFLVLQLAAVLFLTGKVFQLKKGKRHCRHPASLPPHGALSPHDTSDWAIDRFRQAFGSAYVDVTVGQQIVI